MSRGPRHRVTDIVEIVYAAYPKALHAAAGQSVTSHLLKLEREGEVRCESGSPSDPTSGSGAHALTHSA